MIYDIIVIGAGPAGMTASIYAARNKANVCLLEHNDKTGRKILSTGNGKCNITNMNMSSEYYNTSSNADLSRIIDERTTMEVIDFCNYMGIFTRVKNGYVYPYSEQAGAVLDGFNSELSRLNVHIFTSVDITDVTLHDGIYTVKSGSGIYEGRRLIIAGGSKCASKTGSDGSCYKYALSFGHHIVKVIPALTGLVCKEKYFKELKGVRTEAILNVTVPGHSDIFFSERGELQLAEYGISGIPVFQICSRVKRLIDDGLHPVVNIDFTPDISAGELYRIIREMIKRCPESSVASAISGFLNNKISSAVIRLSGLKPSGLCENISNSHIHALCDIIKSFTATPSDTRGFENAQCCAGGVSLDEINLNTMESKLVPGLYFAGEILDVDGICGGYNLTWAVTSGRIAGLNSSVMEIK